MQSTGLKVEFPQLVRIRKKCVGMGALFLETHEVIGFETLLPLLNKLIFRCVNVGDAEAALMTQFKEQSLKS